MGVASCAESSGPAPTPPSFRFSSPILITEEADPAAKVFVADANDDSWLDVLTWGEGAPYINIAIAGQGLSQPLKLAGVPGGPIRQAAWLDLTGDQCADLLVIDADGVLRRFHADSVDEYSEQSLALPVLAPLTAFVTLDVNRDGRLDFVLSGESTEADGGDETGVHLYVLLGAEGGKYTLAHEQRFTPTGAGQQAPFLQPTDVNGDGRWDIVAGIPGVGTGWLEQLEPQPDAGDAGASSSLVLDAGLDADVPTVQPPELPDSFRFRLLAEDDLDVTGVAFIDYDNDGDVDWFRYSDEETRVFENDSAGEFDAESAVNGLGVGGLGCVEDFDNDGRLDVLSASSDIVVKLGTSKSTFADGVELAPGSELPISSLVCVDLDNDGDVDLLTAGKKGTGLYLNRLEPLEVEGGNYFDFRFVGTDGNAAALGTTVEVNVGKKKVERHFFASGQPFLSASPSVHFGLGSTSAFDKVRITWPDATAIEDTDWIVNDTVTATQPE